MHVLNITTVSKEDDDTVVDVLVGDKPGFVSLEISAGTAEQYLVQVQLPVETARKVIAELSDVIRSLDNPKVSSEPPQMDQPVTCFSTTHGFWLF